MADAPRDPPSRAWRIVAILIVGPVLVLAYRTGSHITAEREADQLVRPLCSTTSDGRPDPRAVLHITRGSDALLAVLESTVREGPRWQRAPIARALAVSSRLELLRPLVTILRDGCVELDLVAGTRPGWPFHLLPPDELALSQGARGEAAMETLARDPDPWVRAYAYTFLVAVSHGPVSAPLVALLRGKDVLLRERAAGLAVQALDGESDVSRDAVPGLVELASPSPLGRVAARLVVRRFPAEATPGLTKLSEELSAADRALALDERATARAARGLARGDPGEATVLEGLASRDAGALDALVAAVESSNPIAVRRAAIGALLRNPGERSSAALRRLADDPDPGIQEALGRR